jgi:hypothetical protein
MRTLNLLRVVAVAALATLLAPASFAQVSTSNVTVSVNLTSKCRWQGGTDPTVAINFGTYTAFGAASTPAPESGDLVIECTRGFGAAPTFSWDAGAGKAANGDGVVAGLTYSLSLTAPATLPGSPAAPGTAAVAKTVTFKVQGTMPAGQPGDVGDTSTSQGRTLTVTF